MKWVALGTGVISLGLVAGVAWVTLAQGGQFEHCDGGSVAGGASAIGGPFSVIRDDNMRVTQAEVIDGPTLMYFGYTFCPDICPFDVARNAEAVEILDGRGLTVKPVMVTVDPTRDTPEVLADFVEAMHPRMIGLSGSEADIDGIKQAYRVYGEIASDSEAGSAEYLVDHSTLSYLMAPDHGLLAFFRRDTSPQEMADTIGCFVEAL